MPRLWPCLPVRGSRPRYWVGCLSVRSVLRGDALPVSGGVVGAHQTERSADEALQCLARPSTGDGVLVEGLIALWGNRQFARQGRRSLSRVAGPLAPRLRHHCRTVGSIDPDNLRCRRFRRLTKYAGEHGYLFRSASGAARASPARSMAASAPAGITPLGIESRTRSSECGGGNSSSAVQTWWVLIRPSSCIQPCEGQRRSITSPIRWSIVRVPPPVPSRQGRRDALDSLLPGHWAINSRSRR